MTATDSRCPCDEHQPVTALSVFDNLCDELRAARALVAMLLTPSEQHRAAAAGLQLARDLIEDARDLLAAEHDTEAVQL